ncbi:MAG: nidogen-like domain-containing protein [Myxococcota bacterium]
MAVAVLALTALARPTPARAQCPLIGGFDGPAGYGPGVVPKSDDGSSDAIDITAAFPSGLDFFGAHYTSLFVNVNGNLTFGAPLDLFTPTAFPTDSGVRMIAPFFADVDTRAARGDDNNIYYVVDPIGRRVVVTWLAVDHFDQSTAPGTNTFQVILTARPDVAPGDFDVEFRYAAIAWTTGDSSGGSGGLGGTAAQVGFDAGDGKAFASHPASQTAAVVDIDTLASNHPSACATGSVGYSIRASCGNHVVDDPATEECDPAASTPGCSSLCTVTIGNACSHVQGQPSTCASGCGNGQNGAVEECDDGGRVAGDGCSPICRIEPGATCDLTVHPNVCRTTCASDAECSGVGYCGPTHRCVGDLPPGDTCDRNAMCTSDNCADGVCCDGACDGPCESCTLAGALGICSALDAGSAVAACGEYLCDGLGAGCPSHCVSDDDCAADAWCDADAHCVARLGSGLACARTRQCAVGVCSDGVCCSGPCDGACERCDLPGAAGTCNLLGDGALVAACGAYACDGARRTCPTSCAVDADCAADHFCDAGHQCAADLARAEACDRPGQCASGACADGVCCDDVPRAVPALRRPERRGHLHRAVRRRGGRGLRRLPLRRRGRHLPTHLRRRRRLRARRLLRGRPVPARPRPRPAPADRVGQCASGACADSVCCDTSCGGDCDRCDLAAAKGTCTPDPDGTVVAACGAYRCGGAAACPTACAGDGDCTAGLVCVDAACVPPAPDGDACTRDAACAHGHCVGSLCCDTACDGGCEACDLAGSGGTCTPLALDTLRPACGDYRCDGLSGACPTACELDAQCKSGDFCGGASCQPVEGDGAGCTRNGECAAALLDEVCLTLAIDAPAEGVTLAERRPPSAAAPARPATSPWRSRPRARPSASPPTAAGAGPRPSTCPRAR